MKINGVVKATVDITGTGMDDGAWHQIFFPTSAIAAGNIDVEVLYVTTGGQCWIDDLRILTP